MISKLSFVSMVISQTVFALNINMVCNLKITGTSKYILWGKAEELSMLTIEKEDCEKDSMVVSDS